MTTNNMRNAPEGMMTCVVEASIRVPGAPIRVPGAPFRVPPGAPFRVAEASA